MGGPFQVGKLQQGLGLRVYPKRSIINHIAGVQVASLPMSNERLVGILRKPSCNPPTCSWASKKTRPKPDPEILNPQAKILFCVEPHYIEKSQTKARRQGEEGRRASQDND